MIGCFTRNSTISSWGIRAATWSPWSHLAIIDAPTIEEVSMLTDLVDSTFIHGGVKKRKIENLLMDADEWAFVNVPCPDDAAGMRFAYSQVGKKYDVSGLTGIAFRRDWQDPDMWFCNELFEAACAAAGNRRFREDLARLTPRHSWIIETGTLPVFGSRRTGLKGGR